MNLKKLSETIGLDEDECLELLELFLETSISDLTKLHAALEQDDPKKVAESAHSIKGAAGNMGMQEIYNLAAKIEMDARKKNMDNIPENAALVKNELQKISVSLKQLQLSS